VGDTNSRRGAGDDSKAGCRSRDFESKEPGGAGDFAGWTDIYEKLIKGYTKKQWGRSCRELPVSIIKRLPVRLTFDNNYFNHPYQGIPKGGYTEMVSRMLDGIEVRLGIDFLEQKKELVKLAEKIVYTGMVDAYFDYRFGELQYRSLRFETETLETENYQGAAGMNYTDDAVPYTRIIEHKHFTFGEGNPGKTVVTKEYPQVWEPGMEAYYPIGDDVNHALYQKYKELAEKEENLQFGGRLGTYRYMAERRQWRMQDESDSGGNRLCRACDRNLFCGNGK